MNHFFEGKVGKSIVKWVKPPKADSGEAIVDIDGGQFEISYTRRGNQIEIFRSQKISSFNVVSQLNDDGVLIFDITEKNTDRHWTGLRFLRSGDDSSLSGASAKKKGTRIKSQMPGKIVRVMVKAGDLVTAGQVLLVMEAMKMENEIRSTITGKIKKLSVEAGHAVDSGVELLEIE